MASEIALNPVVESRSQEGVAWYDSFVGTPEITRTTMQALAGEHNAPQPPSQTTVDHAVQAFIAEKVDVLTDLERLASTTEGRINLQDIAKKRYSQKQVRDKKYWSEKVETASPFWIDQARTYLRKFIACFRTLNDTYQQEHTTALEQAQRIQDHIEAHEKEFRSDAYLSDVFKVKHARNIYLQTKEENNKRMQQLRVQKTRIEKQQRWWMKKATKRDIQTQIAERIRTIRRLGEQTNRKEQRYLQLVDSFNNCYEVFGRGINGQRVQQDINS